MKFTILSHAGLLVEGGGTSLVADPWILGSCYWRSWWNYPPPPDALVRDLRPDWVYLSHLHWDHFHGPSLKRFARSTRFLVPEAHFTRMTDDLRSLGFREIVEAPHGLEVDLGGMRATVYQFGVPLDSALAITDGTTTLLDANDCKLMGAPLAQVARRHPRIDFVFKSHSSANPFPHCLESERGEVHRDLRRDEDYCAEFVAFARRVGARHAIPFASNHCFVHRDTRRFNALAVSPLDVVRHAREHAPPPVGPDVVAMVPGDSWSSDKGFALSTHDWFTRRDERIAELCESLAPKLEATYAREARARPDWHAFARYHEELLRALPWIVRRALPARVLFDVEGGEPARWIVDFRRRTVTQAGAGEAWDLRLAVPAAVLNDCVRKRMFSVFTASKRVRYEMRSCALRQVVAHALALDMFEAEAFPLRKLVTRRALRVALRRWREPLLYAEIAARAALRGGRLPRPVDLIGQPPAARARSGRRANGSESVA